MSLNRTITEELCLGWDKLRTHVLQHCIVLRKVIEESMCALIVGRMLRCPVYRYVVERNPVTAHMFKWEYLSCSFSRADRVRSMICHYRFIDRTFRPGLVRAIMDGEVLLWEAIRDSNSYSISLVYDTHSTEGDLSLVYKKNGRLVYTLAFAVIPGRILNIRTQHVMFISRIQGGINYDLIRGCIKAFGGLRPTNMLLSAARAIAEASGITCIAGVRTRHQPALHSKVDATTSCGIFDYDRFWREIGAEFLPAGQVYQVPLKPRHVPLNDRKREHRNRKARQHEIESDLISSVRGTFAQRCLRRRPPEASGVLSEIPVRSLGSGISD